MEHCEDPNKCVAVMEQKAKMENIERDYKLALGAIEESNNLVRTMTGINGELTQAVRGLTGSVKNVESEQKNLHGRITTQSESLNRALFNHVVETTKELGKIRTEEAEKEGELKVGQAETKGALNGKMNLADMFKIAAIISTVLAFYKYVLPVVGA